MKEEKCGCRNGERDSEEGQRDKEASVKMQDRRGCGEGEMVMKGR